MGARPDLRIRRPEVRPKFTGGIAPPNRAFPDTVEVVRDPTSAQDGQARDGQAVSADRHVGNQRVFSDHALLVPSSSIEGEEPDNLTVSRYVL